MKEKIELLEKNYEIQMRLNKAIEKALKTQCELMESLTNRIELQQVAIDQLYKRTNDLLNLK